MCGGGGCVWQRGGLAWWGVWRGGHAWYAHPRRVGLNYESHGRSSHFSRARYASYCAMQILFKCMLMIKCIIYLCLILTDLNSNHFYSCLLAFGPRYIQLILQQLRAIFTLQKKTLLLNILQHYFRHVHSQFSNLTKCAILSNLSADYGNQLAH